MKRNKQKFLKNLAIQTINKINGKLYKQNESITDTGIFSSYNQRANRVYSHFCWKCKDRLITRKMGVGYGLYCRKCHRFRKFKTAAPKERRGGGLYRTDVRKSGALKRKVMLGEEV